MGDYNYTNIYDVADDDHEDNSFGYIDEDFGIGQRSSEDELQSELEYLIGEMSRCVMIIIWMFYFKCFFLTKLKIFKFVDRSDRKEAGHRLELMLLECSYNAKICNMG